MHVRNCNLDRDFERSSFGIGAMVRTASSGYSRRGWLCDHPARGRTR